MEFKQTTLLNKFKEKFSKTKERLNCIQSEAL